MIVKALWAISKYFCSRATQARLGWFYFLGTVQNSARKHWFRGSTGTTDTAFDSAVENEALANLAARNPTGQGGIKSLPRYRCSTLEAETLESIFVSLFSTARQRKSPRIFICRR